MLQISFITFFVLFFRATVEAEMMRDQMKDQAIVKWQQLVEIIICLTNQKFQETN